MLPHLLRCQGFAGNDYSFTLGSLEAGAPSTFAQLGYKKMKFLNFRHFRSLKLTLGTPLLHRSAKSRGR